MRKYLRLDIILPLGLVIFIISSIIFTTHTKREAFFRPTNSRIDLTPILSKSSLNAEDYAIIYAQTGIARPLTEELKTSPNFISQMLAFQNDYFKPVNIVVRPLPPVTGEDYNSDEKGNALASFQLAPFKDGDLFFTKSTHTLGWRHGHAGLVVDAKRGKTLEAYSPGTISSESDASRWRYYPTFKMMRLKNRDPELISKIITYARTKLMGLPYNILASKKQGNMPSSTHCSLLIWQAFKSVNIDLDSNQGIFVSPENLASSPLLETLQIFGFDPSKDW